MTKDEIREQARAAAWKQYGTVADKDYWDAGFDEGFDAGYAAAAPKWTAVEEGLPEVKASPVHTMVAVQVSNDRLSILHQLAAYFPPDGGWISLHTGKPMDDDLTKVIAWMPLPPPYTPEKEAECDTVGK